MGNRLPTNDDVMCWIDFESAVLVGMSPHQQHSRQDMQLGNMGRDRAITGTWRMAADIDGTCTQQRPCDVFVRAKCSMHP